MDFKHLHARDKGGRDSPLHGMQPARKGGGYCASPLLQVCNDLKALQTLHPPEPRVPTYSDVTPAVLHAPLGLRVLEAPM